MGRKAKRVRVVDEPLARWEREAIETPRWEVDLEAEERPKARLEDLTQDECGKILAEYIDLLKTRGRLNAKEACLLAYWSTRSGAVGVEATGYPPEKQSRTYSSYWDSVVGGGPSDDIYIYIYITVSTRRSGGVLTPVPAPALSRRCRRTRHWWRSGGRSDSSWWKRWNGRRLVATLAKRMRSIQ